MMTKELLVTLLLAVSINFSLGRYLRRNVRAQGPWESYESWPSNYPEAANEYMEERRSVPIGFSAMRGKRARNPENAALVSALMKLAKLRSQEASKGDYLQDNFDSDDDQFGEYSRFNLNNDFNLPTYHTYESTKRASMKNYLPTDRREVPQGFFIARGRKRASTVDDNDDDVPFGFFSARGKKNQYSRNHGYDPSTFDALNRRAIPEGFYVSRGKRDLEVPTYGADEQRLAVVKPHSA